MRGRGLALALILVQALTAIGLVSCGSNVLTPSATADTGNYVKIGLVEPFTGDSAGLGQGELNGFYLANRLRPTVLQGQQVRITTLDSQSNQNVASSVAEQLVESDKVSILAGGFNSSVALPISVVANRRKIPYVSISSTVPQITQNNIWAYRVCYTDDYQGRMAAHFVTKQKNPDGTPKYKRIAVSYNSDTYSEGNASFFKNAIADDMGPDAISYYDFFLNEAPTDSSKDRYFVEDIKRIAATNPDLIFIPATPKDGANFIEQCQIPEIKKEFPDFHPEFLLTDDAYNPDFLKYGGKKIEGAHCTTAFYPMDDATDVTKEFIQIYRDYYKDDPDSDAALGFDAYNFICDAIERAGTTEPNAVRKAMAQTYEFNGVTGVITMGDKGTPPKPLYVLSVKDGGFVYEDYIPPETNED